MHGCERATVDVEAGEGAQQSLGAEVDRRIASLRDVGAVRSSHSGVISAERSR